MIAPAPTPRKVFAQGGAYGCESFTPYSSKRMWTNQGGYKGASARFRRLPGAWIWCKRSSESLGFRFAYDNKMTLAICAHATDSMQDAATAALEEAFS